MPRPAAAFLSVLALAWPLSAQKPQVAPKPLIDIEIAGPAVLRERFLPTDLGSLLGSRETKTTWSQLVLEVASVWYRSEGANKNDTFAPFEFLLANYRGDVRLRAYAVPNRGPIRPLAWLQFAPDGKSDLAAIARGIRRLVTNFMPRAVRRVKVGEREVECLYLDGVHVSLPRVVDGALEVLVAESMAAAVPIVAAARAGASPSPRTAPIRGRVDVAGLLEVSGAIDNLDRSDFLSGLLRYDALQSLEFAVRPVGPHVQIDVALDVKEFGTLYDILLPETKAPPPVEQIPNVRFWSHLPVSWSKLRETVAVFAAGEDDVLVLLDNLRPGLTILGEDLDAASCVLSLEPGDDVTAALDGVFGKIGAVEDRKKHRGVEVVSFRATRTETGYRARHKEQVYFGIGKKGPALLRAALDVRLGPEDSDPEPPGLSRAARGRYDRFRPKHCNGAGVLPVDGMRKSVLLFFLEDWYQWLRVRLEGVVDLPRDGARELRRMDAKVGPLLKKYRLDDVAWFSARKGRRLSFRFVW